MVSFFCNDNNSRTTAGVRETVTKDGEMMQKRYLLKFVPDLYKDFAADNFATTISASSFTRLKPFWVEAQNPREGDVSLQKTRKHSVHACQVEGFAASCRNLR